MQQMLEEFKTIPGAMGGFALHPKQGILANSLPPMFQKDKLLEVSRELLKISTAMQMGSLNMQDISLHFDGSMVMMRRISDQLFLVLICEPQANAGVVGMSLSLAVEGLRARQGKRTPVPNPKEDRAETPESIRASGPLVEPLEKLEEGLAVVMGPMAGMILDEAVEEWFESGTVSFEALSCLVRILCREIGDARKVQQFQAQIGPYGQL